MHWQRRPGQHWKRNQHINDCGRRRIQNQIKNINTTTRTVFFDRRYTQGGFSPPWLPSTTVGLGSVTGGTVTASAQRIQWVNQTPYF